MLFNLGGKKPAAAPEYKVGEGTAVRKKIVSFINVLKNYLIRIPEQRHVCSRRSLQRSLRKVFESRSG